MPDNRESVSPGKAILLALSAILTGGLGSLLGDTLSKSFLDKAHPGVAPLVLAIFFAVGIAIGCYYWMILGYGGYETGSPQRARYNRLRTLLRGGGRVGPAYERLLRVALDGMDRLLGDAQQREETLLSRLFSLKERAPLWTARSFDRSLLIAFIYPVAMVFVIWAVSGHIGPAEGALGLPPDLPDWRRWITLIGAAFFGIGIFRYLSVDQWNREKFSGALAVLGFAILMFAAGPRGGSLPLSALLVIVLFRADMPFSYFFVLCTAGFVGTCVGLALGLSDTLAAAMGIAMLAGGSLYSEKALTRRPGLLRWFILMTMIAALATAFLSPLWLAKTWYWSGIGSILLFYGLLAVINAPFDWATLGLTRALLRRGLELGGWWPLVFGLVDLVAATVVVTGLAVTILLSLQLFEILTIRGGGYPAITTNELLAALAHPVMRTAPEYWWLYAMLVSTLIPSIINVALGALSIIRGLPGLHKRLARMMPVGRAVLDSERLWMAPVLAAQGVIGLAVGVVVMLGLIWIIFAWIFPLVGLNLFSMLQALAAANLPGRLLG